MRIISLEALTKLFLEILLFVIITIILFNEFTQILQTLNIFDEESIKTIGTIAGLITMDNLLSKKFLGLNIFR